MMMITRRDALAFGAALSAAGLAGAPALAQQRFFRIGTGGTGGTYYPVGGMIANAISTPTVNVSAVATNGSVANVNGIVGGSMESGFSQADINAWAYTGTGIYEGKPKIEELRVIANLYPESVHVVVKKGAGIKTLADLKGKRVSLDEPGSGTLVNARALLAAYGVTERDIRPEYLKQVQCAEKLKDGSLDGYFQTTGYPQGTLSELAATNGFELLAIDGAVARQDHGAVQVLREGQDPGRHLQGREGRRDHRGRRAVDHDLQAAGRSHLRDHQGAVERQDPRRDGRGARQGQGHQEGNRAAGRRHSAACGRREVLQGSGHPEVTGARPLVSDGLLVMRTTDRALPA